MMKKACLLFVLMISGFLIFAQEEVAAGETSVEPIVEAEDDSEMIETSIFGESEVVQKQRKFDIVAQLTPTLYVNSEKTTTSAPSPIVYPVSIGVLWPNNSILAIQPTLSFFTMNHLFYDGKALPAEIENRTTTTLSFMLNIPAVYTLRFEKSRLQIMGGLGVFLRFGLLANGVSDSDSGYSGSAGKDVEEINKWFWSNIHFLYITSGVSWLFNLTETIKAGPMLEIDFPIGSIFSGEALQGMLISVGVKLSL